MLLQSEQDKMILNVAADWLALLFRGWEVTGSILGPRRP